MDYISLYDKIQLRILNGEKVIIDDLSREELLQIWFIEEKSDHTLAVLFNTGDFEVSKKRKSLNVMKRFITQEDNLRKMDFIELKKRERYVAITKKQKLSSLLTQSTIKGMFEVFLDQVNVEREYREDEYEGSVDNHLFDVSSDSLNFSFHVKYEFADNEVTITLQQEESVDNWMPYAMPVFDALKRKIVKMDFSNVKISINQIWIRKLELEQLKKERQVK